MGAPHQTSADRRERLRTLLCSLSVKTGDVVLTSGRRSDFYVDCKQTALHPEGVVLVGQVMLDRARDAGLTYDAVGGPTLGADPLATSFAIAAHRSGEPVAAFIIRKQAKAHGTSQWIEGRANLPDGGRLLLLEDVITTGGSTLQAIGRLRQEGFLVAGVVVLVDRDEGGRQALEDAGVEVFPVFRRHDLLCGSPASPVSDGSERTAKP